MLSHQALLLAVLAAAVVAELQIRTEGSGDDSDDLLEEEGSGEAFIEDLQKLGDHNKVLKVVPDNSDNFDISFGKDDDYYDDDDAYLDNYEYGDREENSVLKVTKDEEKVVEMDIEIKPKPPAVEDELLLDTAQILIMVGSAFISFGVVMLAFFLCRQRLEASREKAMPYTIPASRPGMGSPIVKNYQRVPASTQQLLAAPHIEMYREAGERAEAPLLP